MNPEAILRKSQIGNKFTLIGNGVVVPITTGVAANVATNGETWTTSDEP